MRAVLDTNVVVSALIWGGKPFFLLEAAVLGDLTLVISPALLMELRDVLSRHHLKSRVLSKHESVQQAIASYAGLAVSVTPATIPRAVPGDEDDDDIVATAVAGQVDLIISGDRHLLSLGCYQLIRVVTPAEALAFLGK